MVSLSRRKRRSGRRTERAASFEFLEPRRLLAGDLHQNDRISSAFSAAAELETIPPRVTAVRVGGEDWTPSFRGAVDAEMTLGYPIPLGTTQQTATLPWVNLDQISITFNEDVQVAATDLSLFGINVANYQSALAAGDFDYDPDSWTATWTLATPLTADKLLISLSDTVTDLDGNRLDGEWTNGQSLLSGNGVAGGRFKFRLNALPADVNQSQLVAAEDALTVIGKVISLPGQPVYSAFSDVNGNGLIAADDALLTIDRIISFLPAGEFDVTPPVIAAGLAHDSGTLADDGLTFDATIQGTVTDDESSISSLTATVDGGTPAAVSIDASGSFTFDPGLPSDGSGDGEHTIRLIALDEFDNEAAAEVAFTLDTVPPTDPPAFELDPEFDTEPVGDARTTASLVRLRGVTQANARVKLQAPVRQTTANAQGAFTFSGIPLQLGDNQLTAQVQVFDAAGNAANASLAITREARTDVILLAEGDQFVTEATQLVQLGQTTGTRTISFALDSRFDTSDQGPALEDIFAAYLVDPNNPQQTLLDRGVSGTALFTLAGQRAEFVPGVVRYDGAKVEIV